MKNKKVLIIVSEDWYFFSHRLDLAKYAIRNGYDIALLSNFHSHQNKIKDLGIKTYNLGNFRKKLSIINEIKNFYCLYKTIKKFKPNIIHAVSIKISIYTAIINIFCKTELLVTAISGLGYLYIANTKFAIIMKNILNILFIIFLRNKKTYVIVQNSDDLKIFHKLKFKKQNIRLIRGVGVDIEKFKPNNNQNKKIRIILACRLLWSKGIKIFFDCAKEIKSENNNVEFILAGRIDELNPDSISIKEIKEFEENSIINWIGDVQDINIELCNSDIMLFPSLYGEGVPKILLEAASCALPIITFDVPGCREVVINNKNGFLVKVHEKKQLINKLKQLISDRNLRETMGIEGRKLIIKNFLSDKMSEQTIQIWKQNKI